MSSSEVSKACSNRHLDPTYCRKARCVVKETDGRYTHNLNSFCQVSEGAHGLVDYSLVKNEVKNETVTSF